MFLCERVLKCLRCFRKHGPEIYQRHLLTSEYPQEDEMNLTDQCPSFLLDGTDAIKPSLFKEKSDKGNVTKSENESAEQPPIATFEEWTKQKLEQEKRRIQVSFIFLPWFLHFLFPR